MDLLILGATARAAAHSALRAGLRPAAVDLFADRDLAGVVPFARRVDRSAYPDGLEAIAAEAPSAPWLYTGALENHPDLVDRIARVRPLWGNPGSTLRAVRDPIAVADALGRAGLPHPRVSAVPDGLPRDGSWLVKPLASAAGRGIRPLLRDEDAPERGHYYQERIAGEDLAALFVGARASARLLGVTRQWIGRLGDRRMFSYVGSVGPRPIQIWERSRISELGVALTSAFGLVGLFGVDLILRDGLPYPVEVNPRYTASVEVLEIAQGQSLLAEHARIFDRDAGHGKHLPALPQDRPAVVGKAILFAPSPGRFPDGPSGWDRKLIGFSLPRCADIPAPGSLFEADDPVMTLFARGSTLEDCRQRLERRLAIWARRLARGGGPGARGG